MKFARILLVAIATLITCSFGYPLNDPTTAELTPITQGYEPGLNPPSTETPAGTVSYSSVTWTRNSYNIHFLVVKYKVTCSLKTVTFNQNAPTSYGSKAAIFVDRASFKADTCTFTGLKTDGVPLIFIVRDEGQTTFDSCTFENLEYKNAKEFGIITVTFQREVQMDSSVTPSTIIPETFPSQFGLVKFTECTAKLNKVTPKITTTTSGPDSQELVQDAPREVQDQYAVNEDFPNGAQYIGGVLWVEGDGAYKEQGKGSSSTRTYLQGQLQITNSDFKLNEGVDSGAIFVRARSDKLVISDCTFQNNSAYKYKPPSDSPTSYNPGPTKKGNDLFIQHIKSQNDDQQLEEQSSASETSQSPEGEGGDEQPTSTSTYVVERSYNYEIILCFSTQLLDADTKQRIGKKVGFSWEDESAGALDYLLPDPPIVYVDYVPNTNVVLQRQKRYAYPVGGSDTLKPFRYLYTAFIGLEKKADQSLNTIHIIEEGKYRTNTTIKVDKQMNIAVIGEVKTKTLDTINSSLSKLVQIENNDTDIMLFYVRREGELTLKDLGINKLVNPYEGESQQRSFAIEAGANGLGKLTLTDVYFFANTYNFFLRSDVKQLTIKDCKFEIHRSSQIRFSPNDNTGKLKYKQLDRSYADIDDFKIKSASYDYIQRTWGQQGVENEYAAAVVIIVREFTGDSSVIEGTTFRNIRRLQHNIQREEYEPFITGTNNQSYPKVGDKQDAFKIASALAIFAPRIIDQVKDDGTYDTSVRIGGKLTISNSKFINCRSPLTGVGAVIVDFNFPDNEKRDQENSISTLPLETSSGLKLPSGAIQPTTGYALISITDSLFVECKGRLAGAILLTGEDLPTIGVTPEIGQFTLTNCIFSDNTAVYKLTDNDYDLDSISYQTTSYAAVALYEEIKDDHESKSFDNVAQYYPYNYAYKTGLPQIGITSTQINRGSSQLELQVSGTNKIKDIFGSPTSAFNPTSRLYDFGTDNQKEYKNREVKGYRINLQGTGPYEEEGIQILYGSSIITVEEGSEPAIIKPLATSLTFYDKDTTASSSELYAPMILFAGASRTILSELILKHFDQLRVNVPLLEVSEYAEVQFKSVNFQNDNDTVSQKTPFIQIFGGIVYIDNSNIQGAHVSKETSFIVASKNVQFEKGRFDNKPGWLYHLERNLRSLNYLPLIDQQSSSSSSGRDDEYISSTQHTQYDDEGDDDDDGYYYMNKQTFSVSNKNKDQIVNNDVKFNSDSNDESTEEEHTGDNPKGDGQERSGYNSLMDHKFEFVEGTARKEGVAVIIIESNISNINRELGDEVEVIPPEEGEEDKGPTYNIIGRGSILDASDGVYTVIQNSTLSGAQSASSSITSNSYQNKNMNKKDQNKNKKKNEGFDPLVNTCEWYSAGIATHGSKSYLFVKGSSKLTNFAEGAVFAGQGSKVVVDKTSKFTSNTNPTETGSKLGVQRNIHCRGSGSHIDAQSDSFKNPTSSSYSYSSSYSTSFSYGSNKNHYKYKQHSINDSNALWGLIKDESDDEGDEQVITEKGNQRESLWLMVRDQCEWLGDGWTGKHSDLFFVPSMEKKFKTSRKKEMSVTITGDNLYQCGVFGLRVCEFGSQTRCKKETIEKMNVKQWDDNKGFTVTFPFITKEQKQNTILARENVRKSATRAVGVRLQFGSLHSGSAGKGMGNAVDMHKFTKEYFINVPGDVLVSYLVVIILGIVGLIVAGIVCCIMTWYCNRRMKNKRRVTPEGQPQDGSTEEPLIKPSTSQSQQGGQQIQPPPSQQPQPPKSRSGSNIPLMESGGGGDGGSSGQGNSGAFTPSYQVGQSPGPSQQIPQTQDNSYLQKDEILFGGGSYYNSAQPSSDAAPEPEPEHEPEYVPEIAHEPESAPEIAHEPESAPESAPAPAYSQQVYDESLNNEIDKQLQIGSGGGGMNFSSDYE